MNGVVELSAVCTRGKTLREEPRHARTTTIPPWVPGCASVILKSAVHNARCPLHRWPTPNDARRAVHESPSLNRRLTIPIHRSRQHGCFRTEPPPSFTPTVNFKAWKKWCWNVTAVCYGYNGFGAPFKIVLLYLGENTSSVSSDAWIRYDEHVVSSSVCIFSRTRNFDFPRELCN